MDRPLPSELARCSLLRARVALHSDVVLWHPTSAGVDQRECAVADPAGAAAAVAGCGDRGSKEMDDVAASVYLGGTAECGCIWGDCETCGICYNPLFDCEGLPDE